MVLISNYQAEPFLQSYFKPTRLLQTKFSGSHYNQKIGHLVLISTIMLATTFAVSGLSGIANVS